MLGSLSLLEMTLVAQAILLTHHNRALVVILARVGARGVYGASEGDALHVCSQVAYGLRNMLQRRRVPDNNLIQMIVHMVDTVRAVCVVSLVGQICMICNVGPICH